MAEEKKPKYKVGDVITIKKVRKEKFYDYRFSFTDRMLEDYGGKRYKIREAVYWDDNPCRVPDDGYKYKLELEGADFSWASSMFEDPDESLSCIDEISDSSIDAFIRRKKCPELDFNL